VLKLLFDGTLLCNKNKNTYIVSLIILMTSYIHTNIFDL